MRFVLACFRFLNSLESDADNAFWLLVIEHDLGDLAKFLCLLHHVFFDFGECGLVFCKFLECEDILDDDILVPLVGWGYKDLF